MDNVILGCLVMIACVINTACDRAAPAPSPKAASQPAESGIAKTEPARNPSNKNSEAVAQKILQSLNWGKVRNWQVAWDHTITNLELVTQPYDEIELDDPTRLDQGPRLQVLSKVKAVSGTAILGSAPWSAASLGDLGPPDRRETGEIAWLNEFRIHEQVKVEWHWWSWAALGIDAKGECRALRIDGARWRAVKGESATINSSR